MRIPKPPRALILAAVFGVIAVCLDVSDAAAKGRDLVDFGSLNTDESSLNRGEASRLSLAELSVFARRPDAGVWEFEGKNWLQKNRKGKLIPLEAFSDRYPTRRLGELVDVYRMDLDQDGSPEFFVFVRGRMEDGIQYGATLLSQRSSGLEMLFYPTHVPGERYQMLDLRDHDGDGRSEVILAGEGGEGDFYKYISVLAMNQEGALQSMTLDAPETIHLMDMNQDGKAEFLVRKVVSRRGERPLYWTLVDRITLWDGVSFQEEPIELISYHDQETKPRLIDELLDFNSMDLLLLETKIEVIRQVHAHVVAQRPIGVTRDSSVVFARVALEKGRKKRARTLLERAVKADPYRVDALYELAKLEMWAGREREAIALLYRGLGVKPQSGPLWMTLGLCFSRLGESETAVAAMVNSARLSEEPSARLTKLERLAETYRDKKIRLVIQKASDLARKLIEEDAREMEGLEE